MADGYDAPDYIVKVVADNTYRGQTEWAVNVERPDGTTVEEYGCDGSLNNAMVGAARIIRADSINPRRA